MKPLEFILGDSCLRYAVFRPAKGRAKYLLYYTPLLHAGRRIRFFFIKAGDYVIFLRGRVGSSDKNASIDHTYGAVSRKPEISPCPKSPPILPDTL